MKSRLLSGSTFVSEDNSDIVPLLNEQELSVLSESALGPPPGGISEPSKYFIGITLGIILGVVLNILNVNHDYIGIITLPGALFLRSLQCAVIPMMFFNIVSSVVDIFGSGSAGNMGKKALWLYTLSTVLATIEGIVFANLFSSFLDSDKGLTDDDDGSKISMACPKELGVLTVQPDGTLFCIPHDSLSALNLTSK
jgi:L-cystine uptake protein TcyP (sodium:dicarboxylate symporter family)